jgi:hypothetical protein
MKKNLIGSSEPAEGGHGSQDINVESTALVEAPSMAVQSMRQLVSRISDLVSADPPLKGLAKTARQALKRSGECPLSPAQIKTLQEWEKNWNDLQAVIDAHMPEKVNEQLQRHSKEIHGKVLQGEAGHHIKSHEEIWNDMESVREHCKAQMGELYVQHRDMARDISGQVAEIIRKTAARILANEKFAHEFWDVPFTGGSSVVVYLRKCESFVLSMTNSDNIMHSPRAIFPYLPF